MPIKITRNGLHKLKDAAGVLLSSHSDTDEAIEKASSLPNGTYTLEPATKTFIVTGNIPAAPPAPTPAPPPPAPAPPAPTPPAPPPPAPSPSAFTVSTDGETINNWSYETPLTDSNGDLWRVNGGGTSTGTQLSLNGQVLENSAAKLTIYGGLIYGQHVAGDWYSIVSPDGAHAVETASSDPTGPGGPSSAPPPAPTPPAPPPPSPAPPPSGASAPRGVVLGFAPYGSVDMADASIQSVSGDSTMRRFSLNAHLSLWFEHRGTQVLAWIENSTSRTAGIKSYDGTLSLTINGVARASNSITLCGHQRAAACLPQLIAGGEAPIATPTIEAANVPHYGVPATEAKLAAQSQTYVPLSQGSYPLVMGTAGYDISIGPLPEWDALYLASAKDQRAARAVVIQGLLAGRYPIHLRDDTTQDFLSFSANPNFSLDASTTNDKPPEVQGQIGPKWTNSHHPSVGFLAYLLTGWRYFADEVCFASSYIHFSQVDWTREFAAGIIKPTAGANTPRGSAWAIRTMTQAALVAPGTQFETILQNNLDWAHKQYVEGASNPQGFMLPYSDYTGVGDGKYVIPPWMDDFETAAWGYMLANFPSTKAEELFAWKAKSIVGRLGPAGDPTAYNYRDAAQYTLPIATSDTPDWDGNGDTGPWFGSWGDLYTAVVGHPNNDPDGPLRGSSAAYPQSGTGYWANLTPAITYAVYHEVDGAAAAFARMTGASNWANVASDFANNPVWGVIPGQNMLTVSNNGQFGKPAVSTLPDWLPEPGTFVNLGASTLDSVKPSGWPNGDVAGPYAEWSGATFNPSFSTLGSVDYYGSGHLGEGAPLWAGVWCFDLDDLVIKGRCVPPVPFLEPAAARRNIDLNAFGESTVPSTLGFTYTAHPYAGMCTQTREQGGGPQGSLLVASLGGAQFGAPVHRHDLSLPNGVPVRLVDNLGGNSYPMAATDPKRAGFWYLDFNGNGPLQFVKFSDGSRTAYPGVQYNEYGNHSMIFMEEFDAIFCMGSSGPGGVEIAGYLSRIVNNVPQPFVKVSMTGPRPADTRCGGTWWGPKRKIVSYEAAGSSYVHVLTPPANNLETSAWTWAKHLMLGANGAVPSQNAFTNGSWGRFVFVPSIGSFIWCDSVTQVPQCWCLPLEA